MAASFPTVVVSKPTGIVDGLQILAAHVGLAWDEIVAMEAELLGSGTGGFAMDIRPTTAGNVILQSRQASGDTQPRFQLTGDGTMRWGPGNAATDVTLQRTAARTMTLTGSEVITPGNAADTVLLLKGAASQTGPFLEVQNNTAGVLFRVTSAGVLSFPAESTAGTTLLTSRVTGDTQDRLTVSADGTISWGPGNATADTNLYRSGANVLSTDDLLQLSPSATPTTAAFGIKFGNDASATLYRSAAGTLKTDGTLQSTGGFVYLGTGLGFSSAATGASASVISLRASGDTQDRLLINASGSITLGSGSAVGDTNLFRDSQNLLRTNDQFMADDGVVTKGINTGALTDFMFNVATDNVLAVRYDTNRVRLVARRSGTTWDMGSPPNYFTTELAPGETVPVEITGSGVDGTGGEAASFGTGPNSVTVNGGTVYFLNKRSSWSGASQGTNRSYRGEMAQTVVTVSDGHATLPRVDLVYARMPAGSTGGPATIEIANGTATSGANLTNLTGMASWGQNGTPLFAIFRAAGATGAVTNSLIRDLRLVPIQGKFRTAQTVVGAAMTTKWYAPCMPHPALLAELDTGTVSSSRSNYQVCVAYYVPAAINLSTISFGLKHDNTTAATGNYSWTIFTMQGQYPYVATSTVTALTGAAGTTTLQTANITGYVEQGWYMFMFGMNTISGNPATIMGTGRGNELYCPGLQDIAFFASTNGATPPFNLSSLTSLVGSTVTSLCCPIPTLGSV